MNEPTTRQLCLSEQGIKATIHRLECAQKECLDVDASKAIVALLEGANLLQKAIVATLKA